MSRSVLLDNIAHQDLRVRAGYSAEFGDKVNNALIFPTEFAYAQREYPILFRKDSGGKLQAVALLGLDQDENLFLDDKGWNARYVPAVHQRGPFLIGFQQAGVAGDLVREPVIHVDLDHPRISQDRRRAGVPAHGGNTPYLEHANRDAAVVIYDGHELPPDRCSRPSKRRGWSSQRRSRSSSTTSDAVQRCRDFSRSRRERLAALDGAQLERLHGRRLPAMAQLVVSSLGQRTRLIELKKQLAGQPRGGGGGAHQPSAGCTWSR